jgi:UDP-N-acetylglucosamine 1-carboxyvinyltransferase
MEYKKPNPERVGSIRASTYLIGACLSRFGICHLQAFGGCNFAKRPIDLHLLAAQMLGACVEETTVCAKALSGADITLPKVSVGATANAVIMSSTARGITRIKGFAAEPHIMNLIDYLRSAGASIEINDGVLTVKGGELGGGEVEIIGDMIEAGTYAAMAVATGGDLTVSGFNRSELNSALSVLSGCGATVRELDGALRVFGKIKDSADIVAEPYPAFPTDLQPIFAALFGLFAGCRIKDNVFPTRFGYLDSLSPFGIKHSVKFSCAHIYPKSVITPATVGAPDLRGAAACLIAALAANGESCIFNADILARGYESLSEKIRSVGGEIDDIVK